MPLISVVIPTYNRGYCIARAIESVLKQTMQDYEVIVVDDGSTDDTAEKLQAFADRIAVVQGPHLGVSEARNTGIRRASGEYLAFLDSDDTWFPHKLERVMQVFAGEPSIGMVTSNLQLVNPDTGEILGIKPQSRPGKTYQEMLIKGSGQASGLVVKRQCLELVGLFDSTTDGMEDYELILRVSKRFPFRHLEEPLGNYYLHVLDTGGSMPRVYRAYITMFQRVLDSAQKDGLNAQTIAGVKGRLAHSHYLLGLIEAKKGRRGDALRYLRSALCLRPWVGWTLEKKANLWRRLILVVKPFAVLAGVLAAPQLLQRDQTEKWDPTA